MRQLAVLGLMAGLVGLVNASEQGGTVKCKADGLHLCCSTCDETVMDILGKVPGISAVKVDRKAADKVTFEANTEGEAKQALDALIKGGLCCSVTAGAKTLAADAPKVDVKGDVLVIKDVHVCCGACTKAIRGLFKDATITVSGTGAQKDVTIAGKNLDGKVVLETMRKAGFTGAVEAKK
jgi:hypothetical protein